MPENITDPVIQQDPPAPPPVIEPVADEPVSNARERMLEFEEATFGADLPRINGQIERGSGSAYQGMKPAIRKHYEALEALIVAEDALATARTKLLVAEEGYAAAEARVEATAEELPPAA